MSIVENSLKFLLQVGLSQTEHSMKLSQSNHLQSQHMPLKVDEDVLFPPLGSATLTSSAQKSRQIWKGKSLFTQNPSIAAVVSPISKPIEQQPVSRIFQLPDHLIAEIAAFLPSQSCLGLCLLLGREWRRHLDCEDATFTESHERIVTTLSIISPTHLCLSSLLPLLASLEDCDDGPEFTNETLFSLASYVENQYYANSWTNNATERTINNLQLLLYFLPHITSLGMRGSALTTFFAKVGWDRLGQLVPRCVHSLSFHQKDLDFDQLQKLSLHLHENQAVKGCKSRPGEWIAMKLSNCNLMPRSIVSLSFQGVRKIHNFSPHSSGTIFQAILESFPDLKTLSLEGKSINDSVVLPLNHSGLALTQGKGNGSGLRCLSLSNSNITGRGLSRVFDLCPMLRIFKAQHCKMIENVQISRSFPILQEQIQSHGSNLEELYLDHCDHLQFIDVQLSYLRVLSILDLPHLLSLKLYTPLLVNINVSAAPLETFEFSR